MVKTGGKLKRAFRCLFVFLCVSVCVCFFRFVLFLSSLVVKVGVNTSSALERKIGSFMFCLIIYCCFLVVGNFFSRRIKYPKTRGNYFWYLSGAR